MIGEPNDQILYLIAIRIGHDELTLNLTGNDACSQAAYHGRLVGSYAECRRIGSPPCLALCLPRIAHHPRC